MKHHHKQVTFDSTRIQSRPIPRVHPRFTVEPSGLPAEQLRLQLTSSVPAGLPRYKFGRACRGWSALSGLEPARDSESVTVKCFVSLPSWDPHQTATAPLPCNPAGNLFCDRDDPVQTGQDSCSAAAKILHESSRKDSSYKKISNLNLGPHVPSPGVVKAEALSRLFTEQAW